MRPRFAPCARRLANLNALPSAVNYGWTRPVYHQTLAWLATQGVCETSIYPGPGGNVGPRDWTRFLAPWMMEELKWWRSLPGCKIDDDQQAETELFVSPVGDDSADGSRKAPWRTLDRAGRGATAAKVATGKPVTVSLLEGSFRRNSTLLIGAGLAQVTFRSHPDNPSPARITATRPIPASALQPVADPQVLRRLHADARSKVLTVNLHQLANSPTRDFGWHGNSSSFTSSPDRFEVFIDGQPLTLARWPNVGERIDGSPCESLQYAVLMFLLMRACFALCSCRLRCHE